MDGKRRWNLLTHKRIKMNQNLPVEQVIIKKSICSKCNGLVRASVEHMMDKSDKKEFAKEVMEHDLNIVHQSLLEYREKEQEWCECNKK